MLQKRQNFNKNTKQGKEKGIRIEFEDNGSHFPEEEPQNCKV
jgi:hypothetical protein